MVKDEVQEKQLMLKKYRSVAEKVYRKAMADGVKLEPGKGKGLEPKPWCECHSRNPCPIEKELTK